jgi:hypothetical protein
MRVAGNEELWRTGKERRADGGVVTSGVAADVLDEHVNILTLEAVQLAIHQSQVAAVAVATDSPQWPESGKPLCHFDRTDIACVPYLVAGFEVVQILLVPIAVGVADDAYAFQELRVEN